MNSTRTDVHVLLRCARQGDAGAMGTLLDMYRQYLSLLARLQLSRSLLGKVSGSDIVQETFLNAKRGFADFRGETEREWMAWLRRILANRLAEVARTLNGAWLDYNFLQDTSMGCTLKDAMNEGQS